MPLQNANFANQTPITHPGLEHRPLDLLGLLELVSRIGSLLNCCCRLSREKGKAAAHTQEEEKGVSVGEGILAVREYSVGQDSRLFLVME